MSWVVVKNGKIELVCTNYKDAADYAARLDVNGTVMTFNKFREICEMSPN